MKVSCVTGNIGERNSYTFFKYISIHLQQSHKKIIPEILAIVRQTVRDVFYLQKFLFYFYPTCLVNTKTTIPLRVGS